MSSIIIGKFREATPREWFEHYGSGPKSLICEEHKGQKRWKCRIGYNVRMAGGFVTGKEIIRVRAEATEAVEAAVDAYLALCDDVQTMPMTARSTRQGQ